jgi:hypothetical protein
MSILRSCWWIVSWLRCGRSWGLGRRQGKETQIGICSLRRNTRNELRPTSDSWRAFKTCYITMQTRLAQHPPSTPVRTPTLHPRSVAPKLHRALLPPTRAHEAQPPRRKPQKHLVPDADVRARVQLVVRRQRGERAHEREREERMPRLFGVRGDDPVVPPEIARGDLVELPLQLVVGSWRGERVGLFCIHLFDHGLPPARTEHSTCSTVPAQQLIGAQPAEQHARWTCIWHGLSVRITTYCTDGPGSEVERRCQTLLI